MHFPKNDIKIIFCRHLYNWQYPADHNFSWTKTGAPNFYTLSQYIGAQINRMTICKMLPITFFELLFENTWSQSPLADPGPVIRGGTMGRGWGRVHPPRRREKYHYAHTKENWTKERSKVIITRVCQSVSHVVQWRHVQVNDSFWIDQEKCQ